MKYRKLRIAWSVGWGMVLLLFLALWVWSYWYSETAERISSQRIIQVTSTTGHLHFWYYTDTGQLNWRGGPQWQVSEGPPSLPSSGNFLGGGHANIVIPHWVIAIFSAGLGCMPWLPLSNRFSLRTLLIATTLIAFVLGLVVWVVRG